MPWNIDIVQQNLEVAEVSYVVVTDIAQDIVRGDFYRDIRISGGDGGALLIQIRVRATTAAELEVTAPSQQF
jgi:hypothetical protein